MHYSAPVQQPPLSLFSGYFAGPNVPPVAVFKCHPGECSPHGHWPCDLHGALRSRSSASDSQRQAPILADRVTTWHSKAGRSPIGERISVGHRTGDVRPKLSPEIPRIHSIPCKNTTAWAAFRMSITSRSGGSTAAFRASTSQR